MHVSPVIIAAVLTGAATPPQRFDLECSGPPPAAVFGLQQAHVHFRFDLATNKWCEGDCGQVHDILEVQPTVIWLDKSPSDLPAELLHYRQIDRETGQYTYATPHTFEGASCEKQPFSGFPAFKTKF